MFRVFFLLFVIMPIIEIMVLMNVGALLGVGPTIVIVITTAWVGARMVKQQGMATYQSVQVKLAQGEMPSDEIIAALLLLVAGVLLITPGFITDIFGLLLLWPVSRAAIVKSVKKHIVVAQPGQGGFYQQGFGQSPFNQGPQNQSPFDQAPFNRHSQNEQVANNKDTIDGEFERKD